MMINFVSKEGDKPINTQAIIGVKAKMYPVDQMDILNRLTIKHKDKNRLIEFVRSTTREISFVRDFLFCIDKCKMDALSNSSKGSTSKLWKLLERRALKSKIRKTTGTCLFTLEYLLRIYCVKNRWRYIFSFYGVIDLLSILPFYLGLFLPTSKYLASIRILRLLRIFRIFNLTRFTRGRNVLVLGLKESKDKIIVFLSFVLLIVVVIGSIMYMVEHDHPESGFTSIPISIYWAIVTLTTVGYGDISPVTGLGQFLASVVMIIGYGVIAVPTSIVTMEMNKASKTKDDIPNNTERCRNCGDDYHLDGSVYCKTCGHKLNEH